MPRERSSVKSRIDRAAVLIPILSGSAWGGEGFAAIVPGGEEYEVGPATLRPRLQASCGPDVREDQDHLRFRDALEAPQRPESLMLGVYALSGSGGCDNPVSCS